MVTVGAETVQGMYGECEDKVVSHPKPGYPGKVRGGGGLAIREVIAIT